MKPHYVESMGRNVYFEDIAEAIRTLHPHLRGAHIFQQLDILGLRSGFDRGYTGHALPYTFTNYEKVTDEHLQTNVGNGRRPDEITLSVVG